MTFEEILDYYFRVISAGYEPTKARRIVDVYLE